MKLVVALLILFITLPAAAVHAQAPQRSTIDTVAMNSVSGVVFHDMNGDGVQGPSEEAVPFAVVNIQEIGSDLIESMITNESGYFNTGEIAHGTYHVWTEINGQSSVKELIELGELNGTAVVGLAIAPSFNIHLPFVSS